MSSKSPEWARNEVKRVFRRLQNKAKNTYRETNLSGELDINEATNAILSAILQALPEERDGKTVSGWGFNQALTEVRTILLEAKEKNND